MLDLYGTTYGCPYTDELRQTLQWDGEDGRVVHIGVQGRDCLVSAPAVSSKG